MSPTAVIRIAGSVGSANWGLNMEDADSGVRRKMKFFYVLSRNMD
jgi:hypothetical protein